MKAGLLWLSVVLLCLVMLACATATEETNRVFETSPGKDWTHDEVKQAAADATATVVAVEADENRSEPTVLPTPRPVVEYTCPEDGWGHEGALNKVIGGFKREPDPRLHDALRWCREIFGGRLVREDNWGRQWEYREEELRESMLPSFEDVENATIAREKDSCLVSIPNKRDLKLRNCPGGYESEFHRTTGISKDEFPRYCQWYEEMDFNNWSPNWPQGLKFDTIEGSKFAAFMRAYDAEQVQCEDSTNQIEKRVISDEKLREVTRAFASHRERRILNVTD